MKKIIIGILFLCLLLGSQNVFADGTCGTNVKYTISGNTVNFSKSESGSDAVWGRDCGDVFNNSAVTVMNVNDAIRVTDGNGLFSGFSFIRQMNLSKFDVSGVTDMSNMFSSCISLTSLNLSGWDTSSVKNMSYMFWGCSSLTNPDVSGFNTANVTEMNGMFFACPQLSELDLSSWNTAKVTNMGEMFSYCSSLENLNSGGWNTSSVTDMHDMFRNCMALRGLDTAGWKTGNVLNMSHLFYNCPALVSLDVSGWNTAKVTDMRDMFGQCSSLTGLDVSGWNTAAVTNMGGMFYFCSSLKNLDVSGWNTAAVTDMTQMFTDCSSLTSLDVSGWKTEKVTSMYQMFYDCSSLSGLDVSGWRTANVTDMSVMFYNCSSLISLDVSGWNTSNVWMMGGMFSGCSSLTSLDVSAWNTANVSDIETVFAGCSSLHKLTLGKNSVNKNIFQSLPDYKNTWYYWMPGEDAENPLALNTVKKSAALFTSYNYKTMAGTWSTNVVTAGVKIMNAAGVDITGKTVPVSGTSYQLKASAVPSNAPQNFTWSSSSTDIASVDPSGNVTFRKNDTVTITAEAADGSGKTAWVKLMVTDEPVASSFSIFQLNDDTYTDVTKKNIILDIASGETLTLKAAAPFDVYPNITWKTGSSKIAEASVLSNDMVKIKGLKTGSVTVTALLDGTKTKATVKVKFVSSVQPGSIVVSGGSTVAEKKTVKLAVIFDQTVQPTNKKVTWSTSEKAVADVTSAGVVKGVKQGQAVIRACSKENGNICGSWEITVTPVTNTVEIEDLSGGSRMIDLASPELTYNLSAKALSSAGTTTGIAQEFNWKSSASKIAEVDQNGVVKGLKAGKVTITVMAVDGSKKSGKIVLQVRALPQPGSMKISGPDEIAVKKTGKLSVSFEQPVQPTGKKVTWSSSDPAIAKVTNTGAVKGLKAGIVTITVNSVEVPAVTASVSVKITDGSVKNDGLIPEDELLAENDMFMDKMSDADGMDNVEPSDPEAEETTEIAEAAENSSDASNRHDEEPVQNAGDEQQPDTIFETGSIEETDETEGPANAADPYSEEELLTDDGAESETFSIVFDPETSEEDHAEPDDGPDPEIRDANTANIPAEAEDEPEEIITEIRLRNLSEEGLSGTVGMEIEMERDRFEVSDEQFASLIFEIENEKIAKLQDRSSNEHTEKGISILILSPGETKLLVRQKGQEAPLLEVSLTAAAAQIEASEEPVPPEILTGESGDDFTDSRAEEETEVYDPDECPVDVTDELCMNESETPFSTEEFIGDGSGQPCEDLPLLDEGQTE